MVTPMQGARERAERFVMAWLKADYEPDDVDAAWMSERSVERLIDRLAELLEGQAMRPPLLTDRAPAMERINQGAIAIGTPREVAKDCTDEFDLRSPECTGYSVCSDEALRRGWANWSCRACAGPGAKATHQGMAPGEPPEEDKELQRSAGTTVQTNPDGTPWG